MIRSGSIGWTLACPHLLFFLSVFWCLVVTGLALFRCAGLPTPGRPPMFRPTGYPGRLWDICICIRADRLWDYLLVIVMCFFSHRQTYTCTDCYRILPHLVSFSSTPPGIALALPILPVSHVSRKMLHIISHMICVFLRRTPIWKCDDGKLPSLALSSGPVMEGIRIGLVPPNRSSRCRFWIGMRLRCTCPAVNQWTAQHHPLLAWWLPSWI